MRDRQANILQKKWNQRKPDDMLWNSLFTKWTLNSYKWYDHLSFKYMWWASHQRNGAAASIFFVYFFSIYVKQKAIEIVTKFNLFVNIVFPFRGASELHQNFSFFFCFTDVLKLFICSWSFLLIVEHFRAWAVIVELKREILPEWIDN